MIAFLLYSPLWLLIITFLFKTAWDAIKGSQRATTFTSNYDQVYQRSVYGFVGLHNRGATCCLNSVLQTLLFTPEFRDHVLSLGDITANIPRELQRLFARMLLINQPTVDTTDFTNSLEWARGQEWNQQDAHELNRTLFSALEDSLVGTSGAHIISEVYKGVIAHRIQCEFCGFIEVNEEEFLDLTAAVSGHENLHSSFRWKFLNEETLFGRNLYPCQKCGIKTTCRKSAHIRALPPILTVCLLRFEMDQYERHKLNSQYEFPEDLDMSPYFEKADDTATGRREYELFSVIIHSGTAHEGHYHSYIKDIDELGKWQPPETRNLEKIEAVMQGAVRQQRNALRRLGDAAGETLRNVWKYFKDRLCFDSRGVARLNASVSPDVQVDGTRSQTRAHWFDFNDAKISAITSDDFKGQFGGQECAYMLFYRRKEQRPPNAKSNTYFNVPEHLIEEVRAANSQLQTRDLSLQSSGDVRRKLPMVENSSTGTVSSVSLADSKGHLVSSKESKDKVALIASSLNKDQRTITSDYDQAVQRGVYRFVGLRNRGATCYLNSLLQTLLLTPEFRDHVLSLGDITASIPRELQRLFARMLLLNQPTVDTTDFTKSLEWARGQECIQQDVHELNRTLFSALEDSLAGTSGENIVSEVYRGVIVHRVQCEFCEFIEVNEEEFLDLTAAVRGHENLHSSFHWKFLNEEILCGRNLYPCQKCGIKTTCRKSARIRALPPILTVCLLRFKMDQHGRRKLNSHYEFPEDLDMSPYFEKADDTATGGREYELFSVIIHSGTAHGGHYHSYIKDIDELGKWQPPGRKNFKDASRLDSQGVAQLNASVSSDVQVDGTRSESRAHWFDFNDARISAISSDDCKRQFGGQECAYMLFYRRKEQRPLDAKSNRLFKVPERLIKEVYAAKSQHHSKTTCSPFKLRLEEPSKSRSNGNTGLQLSNENVKDEEAISSSNDVIADPAGSGTLKVTPQLQDRTIHFQSSGDVRGQLPSAENTAPGTLSSSSLENAEGRLMSTEEIKVIVNFDGNENTKPLPALTRVEEPSINVSQDLLIKHDEIDVPMHDPSSSHAGLNTQDEQAISPLKDVIADTTGSGTLEVTPQLQDRTRRLSFQSSGDVGEQLPSAENTTTGTLGSPSLEDADEHLMSTEETKVIVSVEGNENTKLLPAFTPVEEPSINVSLHIPINHDEIDLLMRDPSVSCAELNTQDEQTFSPSKDVIADPAGSGTLEVTTQLNGRTRRLSFQSSGDVRGQLPSAENTTTGTLGSTSWEDAEGRFMSTEETKLDPFISTSASHAGIPAHGEQLHCTSRDILDEIGTGSDTPDGIVLLKNSLKTQDPSLNVIGKNRLSVGDTEIHCNKPGVRRKSW